MSYISIGSILPRPSRIEFDLNSINLSDLLSQDPEELELSLIRLLKARPALLYTPEALGNLRDALSHLNINLSEDPRFWYLDEFEFDPDYAQEIIVALINLIRGVHESLSMLDPYDIEFQKNTTSHGSSKIGPKARFLKGIILRCQSLDPDIHLIDFLNDIYRTLPSYIAENKRKERESRLSEIYDMIMNQYQIPINDIDYTKILQDTFWRYPELLDDSMLATLISLKEDFKYTGLILDIMQQVRSLNYTDLIKDMLLKRISVSMYMERSLDDIAKEVRTFLASTYQEV